MSSPTIMEYLRPVWQCLVSLCNCLHCTEDMGNTGYEPTERTHLLADPINSSPALRRTNSDNLSNDFSQSLPKKDQHNALCVLVQNTAMNMIDVGAMDAHNLEHHEIEDRMGLYIQRLQQQWSNIQYPNKAPTGLLKDVPNSEVQLMAQPLEEDIVQMRSFLKKAQHALSDIKVEHIEQIVVPFRIP